MAERENEDAAAAANGRVEESKLETLEREHVEQLARAHAALAAAQDRGYWLERWNLDLNALMRRPAARRLRALLRWVRELRRGQLAVQRYVQTRIGDLGKTAAEDKLAAAADATVASDPPARAGSQRADDAPPALGS